jgi:hypothetical protein
MIWPCLSKETIKLSGTGKGEDSFVACIARRSNSSPFFDQGNFEFFTARVCTLEIEKTCSKMVFFNNKNGVHLKKLLILIFLVSFETLAEVRVMLETGGVWQHRNDVKIPGNTGDRVDFDEFDQGPFFHYRAELFWKLTEKSTVRFLYAPFNTVVTGELKSNVNYNNKTFTAGQDLEVDYTFNSYRVSYIFTFLGTGDSQFNLGISGKIRDAEIKFKQGSQESSYDNVGFVPLIYLEMQTALSSNWLINFNMDGAAASQGRAFDVSFKFRRKLSKNYQLGLGARSLEGGADNDKVYTFSWFNYAVLDLTGSF